MEESKTGGGQVAAPSTPELRCIDCGVEIQRRAYGPRPLRCDPCKRVARRMASRKYHRTQADELPIGLETHMLRGRPQTAEHKRKRADSTARTLASQRRVCIQCGKQYTPTLGAQRYCSGQCWNQMTRKKRARVSRPRLSPREYRFLLERQGGVCAICSVEPHQPGSGRGRGRLAADHDHKTARVRGLLCHDCNTAVGLLKDDPALLAAAIDYLKRA